MLRHTATAAGLLSASLWASLLWASPARAETLLHLDDTETVTVVPDELAASLRAEATSASAAGAQQRVNAAMTDALAHSRKVAGVTASTGAYAVWHVGPTPQDSSARWQASQSLELTSHDGAALLTLVGALQHNGLAIGELGWRLSRAAERKAHDEATRKAILALRGKAQEAAGLLDLRFDSFKEVRLSGAAPMPTPRFAGAFAAMAAPAPPNAVATNVPVSASAEADAILLAK
ncbi:MAG TPA: SIMPL domain-containing protein [Acetobacteraceae bacterium]|nr:SIMPL domain-containing protein [Acetobacteraceae bacterium]